jgi:hypothetical protein
MTLIMAMDCLSLAATVYSGTVFSVLMICLVVTVGEPQPKKTYPVLLVIMQNVPFKT